MPAATSKPKASRSAGAASRPRKAVSAEKQEAQAQARAERLAGLRARLDSAVLDLASEEGWQRMLHAIARTGLRRYSWQNRLLLLTQLPGVTQVAGFHEWGKLGRTVIKGQKALWVQAPVSVKVKDSKAPPLADDEEHRIVAFKPVPVFDISQTEAVPGQNDAFAEADRMAVQIEGPCPAELWQHLASYVDSQGFRLERGDCGPAEGWTEFVTRTVRISGTGEDADAARVLAHEAGHIACGHGDIDDYHRHRGLRETEADSVAYLVCAEYGLDALAAVVPYVTGWAGQTPATVAVRLKEAAATIDAAAMAILSAASQPALLAA